MRKPSLRRGKRSARPRVDPREQEQEALLTQLKGLAEASGLDVREERLMREAGYSVRSGVCRVNGREVLILDRGLPVSERIDLTAGVLAGRDLESIYIEPAMREFLEGGPRPPAVSSEGGDAASSEDEAVDTR